MAEDARGQSLNFLNNIPLENTNVSRSSKKKLGPKRMEYSNRESVSKQSSAILSRHVNREKALDFLTSIPTSAYASEEQSEIEQETDAIGVEVSEEVDVWEQDDLLGSSEEIQEKEEYQQIFKNAKVIKVSLNNGPEFSTISYVRFTGDKSGSADERRRKSAGTITLAENEGSASYGHLIYAVPDIYDPHLFENALMPPDDHYKHIDLASYKSTIIYFVNDVQLASTMNERFLDRYESRINDESLTLDKIRKIKLKMFEILLSGDLEVVTLALSYVLFERLFWMKMMSRENRKLCAAVSLVLAFKFNEYNAEKRLKFLLKILEKSIGVEPKDIYKVEFGTYCSLKFKLHIPRSELEPHIRGIMQQLYLLGSGIE